MTPQDHRNDAYNNSANTADRRQATIGKVYNDMRQNRDRIRTDQVRDRNAQRPDAFRKDYNARSYRAQSWSTDLFKRSPV